MYNYKFAQERFLASKVIKRLERIYVEVANFTGWFQFNNTYNWYFNQETVNQTPVLMPIGEQILVEQDVLQININSSVRINIISTG